MILLKPQRWPWDCTEAAFGEHQTGRDGRCIWCRRRMEGPVSRPDKFPRSSQLEEAYEYFWDPDYGNNRWEYTP